MTNDALSQRPGPNPKEVRRPNDQSPCLIAGKNTRFFRIFCLGILSSLALPPEKGVIRALP